MLSFFLRSMVPSASDTRYNCQARKKEPKPKLFGPDIWQWGVGLPREGVGAKKFGMSLETQGNQTFWRDIPGFCRDIPGATERFEKKKFVLNSGPLNWRTRDRIKEINGRHSMPHLAYAHCIPLPHHACHPRSRRRVRNRFRCLERPLSSRDQCQSFVNSNRQWPLTTKMFVGSRHRAPVQRAPGDQEARRGPEIHG